VSDLGELSHVGMTACFFCGGDKDILLDTRLRNTLPRKAVYDRTPCDTCKEHMKQGVMFISVRDGEEGDNPYRTGKRCVIRDRAVQGWPLDGELKKSILKARVCFVPDTDWKQLGLPDKDTPPRED
jgi:hypothetical protein